MTDCIRENKYIKRFLELQQSLVTLLKNPNIRKIKLKLTLFLGNTFKAINNSNICSILKDYSLIV